jgi:hypothetical protein
VSIDALDAESRYRQEGAIADEVRALFAALGT